MRVQGGWTSGCPISTGLCFRPVALLKGQFPLCMQRRTRSAVTSVAEHALHEEARVVSAAAEAAAILEDARAQHPITAGLLQRGGHAGSHRGLEGRVGPKSKRARFEGGWSLEKGGIWRERRAGLDGKWRGLGAEPERKRRGLGRGLGVGAPGLRNPYKAAASHTQALGTGAAGGTVQDAAEAVVESVPLGQAVEVALVGRCGREKRVGRELSTPGPIMSPWTDEAQRFSQSHTSRLRHSQDWNPGSLPPAT
jgi:hypothetical protein